ncbi:hypothetical protein U1Q18_011427 [Sarracenia purpurea var. burkii]
MNAEEADEEEDLPSFKRCPSHQKDDYTEFSPSLNPFQTDPIGRMSTGGTCSSSSWTREQDKAFENALAIFSEDSSDRWEKIAEMVPGKTIAEIKHHYMILVEDINAIESGYVPLPHYVSSFNDYTNHAGEFGVVKMGSQFGQMQSDSCHGGKSSRSDQERRKGIAWTEDEHR